MTYCKRGQAWNDNPTKQEGARDDKFCGVHYIMSSISVIVWI